MTEKGIMHDVVTFLKNSPEETRQQIWEAFKDGVEKTLTNVIEKEKAVVTGLEELNNKYCGKFLFFNGDENGCQWFYLKEIKNIMGDFYFKGVMIEWDCQENDIQIYECDGKCIADFMYFSYNFGGSEPKTCEELDAALMRQPIDTNRKNHIMTAEEVAEDVMNVMGGMVSSVSGPLVAMPDLARFFFDAADKIKEDYENEVQDC